MRVRKLALAVGLVGALGSSTALALGLGEIKLNSTLNQPLNAEIGLLQTRGLDDTEIMVRLAEPEEFERADVERSYLLTSLQFDVDYSGSSPVIRISSREPIREPYLNFLVETRWPSGRLLREYTLLMDLPAFSPTTAQQPVRAAERERQQVRRDTPAQRPAQRPVESKQQPAIQPEVDQPRETPAVQQAGPARHQPQRSPVENTHSSSQVYGPVSSSDTLWEIALKNRVSRAFSVQQTMLAIQRLNPEAFINNNINLLKKGAVLRLPNADDLRGLSLTEAISQVAEQNNSWRQRSGVEEIATGAPLDARAVQEEDVASGGVEGRVSLAAPMDNESVISGSGSGAGDNEALEGNLTLAEEELDKSQLENTELRERISELDEQIDTMEALVEVSNEEMHALQTAAEQSDLLLDPTEMDVAEGESSTDGTLAADASKSLNASTEQPGVETAAAAPEMRNRVVSVQTKPEPTLVERFGGNMQLIGIGAAGLLVVVFGLFTWRRRKAEQEAVEQPLEQYRVPEQGPVGASEEMLEPDQTLATVESMEADDTFDLADLEDVGTDDPVSEAEIHLSLGQYEEAESKLLLGLEKDPQVVDARLMLMEVYAHNQDVEKFDEHYRQLLAISDGPATDRAARLRETITGAPDFEAPAGDFSSESLEAAQLDAIGADRDQGPSCETLVLDASAEPVAADPGDALEEDTTLLDELTMDLALDDGKGAGNTAGQALSLDLELDLDTTPEEQVGTAGEVGASPDIAFNLDELDLDSALADNTVQPGVETQGEADHELNLDDLELDSLELDTVTLDAGADVTDRVEATAGDAGQPTTGASSSGLDFELDLSLVEDQTGTKEEESPLLTADLADSLVLENTLAVESTDEGNSGLENKDAGNEESLPLETVSEDDLAMIGGELESELDLDSIDLDDIAKDLSSMEVLSEQTDIISDRPASDGEESSSADSVGEPPPLKDALAPIVASSSGGPAPEEEQEPSAGVAANTSPQLETVAEKELGVESDFDDLDFNLESDLNPELSLLEGGDEMETKLELAQAYLDMGDEDGAKDILKEVAQDGGGEHKSRAEKMLEHMV
ncbi:FimV/HubP family polar landmark protein [Microbulbifer sp. 2205BS26-8]|uniref:FimV/HubP family polar landmark protein n=1 Tax=Microbulbifer sp. 2205BS26-8 TaxID=3064386 RepID=UPI00273FD5C5|nr:FimV/HubP family polar landmark protein [Microbulbifer sp. 2205BS26-8]MDP5209529.1 FimV/HubP family polar landmark protein [Microbulbifer sp. 2205BS26-8]